MRKSTREKLQEAKKQELKPVEMDLEGLTKLLLDPVRPADERRINPSQREFIYAADLYSGFMGPAGSAKTSAGAAAGMLRALLQPGSKGLVARHDYNKLLGTTMLRFQDMLNALPKGVLLDRDKTPPMRWWIQPIPQTLPDGTVEDTPSEIMFSGLNDSLGSYEFDWIFIDEADLVDIKKIHEAKSRLRHVAPLFKKLGISPPYRLMLAFNPPDKHHPLYTAATGMDFQGRRIADPWLRIFRPQQKENQRNLPDNYYENMAATLPEDQRQRLVDGDWGSTFEGQPVYREFRKRMHVKSNLRDTWTPNSTLLRFWDFGYAHPACIWAYVDWAGRLIVMKEALGTNIEASEWIHYCKGITSSNFPGLREVADYGDPAVVQKKDTGQTLKVFLDAGIIMRYRSSTIEHGVLLGRQLFSRVIDGEPAVQIDESCHILISAFAGGYRLDDMGAKPKKDGYYDHLADAYRYGLINVFNSGVQSAPVGSTTFASQWGNWIPDNISHEE